MSDSLEVFISHSTADSGIAEALVSLIRSALRVPAASIRCTSLHGYELPPGAGIDSELQAEVYDSKLLVGVLTKRSLASTYVLFELGARWGARKPMIPLLAAGARVSDLGGPLAGRKAISADVRNDIQALVDRMATDLGIGAERPSVYARDIDRLIAASSEASASAAELIVFRQAIMSGQLAVKKPNGKEYVAVTLVLPVRVLNDSNRVINISGLFLDVQIGGKLVAFAPMTMPTSARWHSEEQNISLKNVHDNDLHVKLESLAPGQSVIGYLAYRSDEIDFEEFRNREDRNLELHFRCVDVRGRDVKVLELQDPGQGIHIANKLGIHVGAKSRVVCTYNAFRTYFLRAYAPSSSANHGMPCFYFGEIAITNGGATSVIVKGVNLWIEHSEDSISASPSEPVVSSVGTPSGRTKSGVLIALNGDYLEEGTNPSCHEIFSAPLVLPPGDKRTVSALFMLPPIFSLDGLIIESVALELLGDEDVIYRVPVRVHRNLVSTPGSGLILEQPKAAG